MPEHFSCSAFVARCRDDGRILSEKVGRFKLNLSIPLGFGRVEIFQSPWVLKTEKW
jgi:hypothetical protein